MAYISSPRSKKGTEERLADCYQCLSSTLAVRPRTGAEQHSDADLKADPVEAGWDEEEVSTILETVRREAIANVVSEDLVSASAEPPTAEAVDAVGRRGAESAQGLHKSAENESRGFGVSSCLEATGTPGSKQSLRQSSCNHS